MFEKNMKLAYLLDFYGETLDEHTRDVMRAYYEDDLSLSEIADGESISRQGVRHIIKKGEEHLIALENSLGLARHHSELSAVAESLNQVKEYFLQKGDEVNSKIVSDAIFTILNKGV